jgi:hypothetical protein
MTVVPFEARQHVRDRVKEHLEDDYPDIRTGGRWIKVTAYHTTEQSAEDLVTELRQDGWKAKWWPLPKHHGVALKVTKRDVEWPTQKQ